MNYDNIQSVINIEGFHLDLGNDHHRSFQDILVHICEYGTISLRTLNIIENHSKKMEPEKQKQLIELITEEVKCLCDPIIKLYAIVEGECSSLVHEKIKDMVRNPLEQLKDITQNFSNKMNLMSYSNVCDSIKEVLIQTFKIMRIILLDASETLCDNCDCIARNINKVLESNQEKFIKGSKFIAAQIVNGIGLVMRERGGQPCNDAADCIDQIAVQLCIEPSELILNQCKEILERSKEIFRQTVKPVTIEINTSVIEKQQGVSFVMPKFHDITIAQIVEGIKNEEQAKEEYVTGYFLESATCLTKALNGMEGVSEIKPNSININDLFDEVKKRMDSLNSKVNNNSYISNNPHNSISLEQVDSLCDRLLVN
ncbi:hypothetical protein EDI_007280 [Entamoeba dispar SAW760]|uniref:Uncharacterized protein n=1 Tax=Entamoeba dispar (strain ATCC PRA-260 / SAW760) TaxID=370354 RepID=B0ECD9_ENTDS|nr:uncharacterized protein EDI_007280 [Entamoeba dispar SAW760]EDR27782.1 hypothetical protein EDI_007280 [Entamoeba dispar SAW760]|eukprot:EDR27782.1 hypothetical protein EDI_007280 [Entamoeba dispar SAW760]